MLHVGFDLEHPYRRRYFAAVAFLQVSELPWYNFIAFKNI
jgi:hypothetical protein